MKEFAKLYHIFYSPIFLFARLILVVSFIITSILSSFYNLSYYPYIALSSALLIFEIFFYFKIVKAKPRINLAENKGDMADSMELGALSIYDNVKNTEEIIRQLLGKYRVKFVLEKSNISKSELKFIETPKNLILQKALEEVLKIGGSSIRTSDLLVAYLLLTEDRSHLLLQKELKEEDLLNIISWERLLHPDEREKEHFFGRGVSEDWVYGWITETRRFMLDLTSQVLGKKRFFYPREKEYKTLLDFMSSSKAVILVGDPGSGKDALVEQFIKDSFEGALSKDLNHLKVFQFLVDLFLAGTQNQGELEERFASIVSEISHSKEVVIFIENIETILGSSDFNLDLSGALIPYLQESKIKLIGSISPENYKKYVESKPSFLDHLSVIKVEEPDESEILQILFEKSFEIEWQYQVTITYNAIKKAIELAPKYLPTLSMPGSAVRLLEDTISSMIRSENKILTAKEIIEKTEEKTKIPIASPDALEKEKLLSLEDQIHKFIIDQEEAVSAISDAIRRIRSGVNAQMRPVSFLFLGPTGVGKTQTAKVTASIYFGGEKEIIRVDMSEYSSDDAVARFIKGEPKSFLDQVFNNPFSLILLDEFEKSNPRIMDLFLQILDDGRLTDDKDRTVSFNNCLMVATSNAGSEYIRENITQGNLFPKDFNKKLINELLSRGIFKPELINRFDQVVVFKPLSQGDVSEVTKLILSDFAKHMEKQDIYLTFDGVVLEKVSKGGFDPQFGARPIRRFVQDAIEDNIAQAILKGEIKKGDKVNLSVDTNGKIKIN